MKRIIKTYFKLFIFLFGISLLLVNCEKDIIAETQIENIPKLTVTIVDLPDIESNEKVFSKIKKVIKTKNTYKSSIRDTIVNNEYGFIIDTDYVIYVENGNYNSYNFEIIRDNPEDDKLENLFLTLNADEEYDAFIIKYNFTREEFVTIDYEELNNRGIEITSLNFDSSFLNNLEASRRDALSCESVITGFVCNINGETHTSGFDSSCSVVAVTEIVCTGGGGPGPGPNQDGAGTSDITTGGNQGSGSSGGSNTGTYTPSNPYSAPAVPPPTNAQILSSHLGELTEEQIAWANNDLNRTEYNQLIAYLGSCSASLTEKNPTDCEPVLEFGTLALEALMNGGEVDYDNKVLLDSTFVNNQKAKCVYNKLKEAGGIKNILQDYFDTTQTANLILKIVPNLTCGSSSNPFGCTNFNDNTQTATISIDEDYITQFQWQSGSTTYQTPTLFVARVIIHEAIHAQLFYNEYQLGNGNPVSDLTFEELYEDYRNVQGWQHQYMADHHLNSITTALSEVHPLINDQTFINYINNNYPNWTLNQIYTNMAWSGLTGTPAGIAYLSDPDNEILYSLQNTTVAANSNETYNCP